MATLEKVIEEVKSLTPEDKQQLREILNTEQLSAEKAERLRLANSVRGKYANALTSSEDFAKLKQEEIKLED